MAPMLAHVTGYLDTGDGSLINPEEGNPGEVALKKHGGGVSSVASVNPFLEQNPGGNGGGKWLPCRHRVHPSRSVEFAMDPRCVLEPTTVCRG